MIRIIFIYIFPLLLPSTLYLIWARWGARKEVHLNKKQAPWALLLGLGIVIMGMMIALTVTDNSYSSDEVYIRAKYQNGKIVPSHTLKDNK